MLAFGAICLVLYGLHARRVENPILDLRVLRVATLRASILGGSVFRIGIGAIPFLLPLFMQEGFGYSPLQSGLITFAASAGAFGIRGFSRPGAGALRLPQRAHLGRDDRRRIHGELRTFPAIDACGHHAGDAGRRGGVPLDGIQRAQHAGLCRRAAGAHEPGDSFSFMAQRLSMTVGVALSAFLLHFLSGGAPRLPVSAFAWTFVVIALISTLSAAVF
ncbi:MAG: hypothetical protein WDM84_06665 [Bauldia sp.]